MSMERFSCIRAGSNVSGSAYARQWNTCPVAPPPPEGAVVLVAAGAAGAVVLVAAAAGAAGVSVAWAGGGAAGVAVGVSPPQAASMGTSSRKSTNAVNFFENILAFPPMVAPVLRPQAR